MHILIIPSEHFVTDQCPLGGIFQYEQAIALAKKGHRVGVISVGFITFRYIFQRYPYRSRENTGSVEIFRLYQRTFLIERFVSLRVNKARYLAMFKIKYKEYELANGRPDIIHAHNFLFAAFLAEWLWDSFKIPFVVTEHSSAFGRKMVSEENNKDLMRVSAKAQFRYCVSSDLSKLLQMRFDLKFETLHNMVNEIFFKSVFLERRDKSEFIFLNVASLDHNKNHRLLLRSFAKGFKCTFAQLRIAGEGPLKAELVELTKSLGISNQVLFLGHLSRIEIAQEMSNANCFVLTSNLETFGVVLIEALASGLPLISTRSGGPEDILQLDNGILVDVDSPDQLTAAMIFISCNHQQYSRLQLRAEAFNRFSENVFVQKVTSIYEKSISNIRNL